MISEIRQKNNLYLKWIDEKMQWGVFTDNPIQKGDVVETCYCLIDNLITAPHNNYVFGVSRKSFDVYHVLGFGAIYNHSNTPNIEWRIIDEERHIIEFRALRDIEVGEELRQNYGEEYWEGRKKQPLI